MLCYSLLYMVKWMISKQTCIPSGLNFLPFQSPQGHWIGFPVPDSRFSLVINFVHNINSVCMSIPVSQFIPRPSFPSWHPHVCSLRLCLCVCFGSKIISTIYLNSTSMCWCAIFVFLSLAYFTLYDSLWVHFLLFFVTRASQNCGACAALSGCSEPPVSWRN